MTTFTLLPNETINFKLIKPVASQSNWQTVIPHRDDVMLSDVSAFADLRYMKERLGCNRAGAKLSTGEALYYLS